MSAYQEAVSIWADRMHERDTALPYVLTEEVEQAAELARTCASCGLQFGDDIQHDESECVRKFLERSEAETAAKYAPDSHGGQS